MADQTGAPAAPQGTPAPAPSQTTPSSAPASSGEKLYAGKYKTIEDMEKGYIELQSKMGDFKSKEDAWNEVQQYGGLDTLKQWATYGYQNYAQQGQRQSQQTQQPVQQPAQQDYFANWDVMTPQEQANRLAQYNAAVSQQYINQYVNQIAQQYGQRIQQFQDMENRKFDIYRSVLKASRTNPDLDPDALVEQMSKIATGDLNQLMGMATNALVGDKQAEQQAKALFETWKQDYEQKQKNDQMGMISGGRPTYQVPEAPKTKADEQALIVKRLLEQGLSPGHF